MNTELTTIDQDLDECAYQINLVGKGLAHNMLDLGKWASKARYLLSQRRDGSFEQWVAANCTVSLGYCYGAIRVWDKFGFCDDLKIDTRALLLLASNNVPDEVREQALELAESGEVVTGKRAKELIESSKPGDTDYDRGVEPDCDTSEPDEFDDEPEEPVEPKAPRRPVEPNEIGGMINGTTEEMECTIEGKPAYKVASYLEGVEAWIAKTRQRLGINPPTPATS